MLKFKQTRGADGQSILVAAKPAMDKHTRRFVEGLEALRDRHAKFGSVEVARQVQARIQHIRARYK